MMRVKEGILLKILIPFVGIIIVTLLVVGVSSVTQQKRILYFQQEKKARIFTQNLQRLVADAISFQFIDKIKEKLIEARRTDDDIVWIAVVDSSGRCLASTDDSLDGQMLNEKGFDKQALEFDEQASRDVPYLKNVFEESIPFFVLDKKAATLRIQFSRQNIINQVNKSIILFLIVALASLLSGTFIYLFIARGTIIKPLSLTKEAAAKIALGDLTQELKITSHDEIGELSGVFNALSKGINDIVVQIRKTSESVNNLAQGLSSSTEEINASTQGVSATIQVINKGVEKQASRLEATSGIMEKMIASVKEVAANAQDGAEASQGTTDLAQQGMEASSEAVERIISINKVANDFANIVEKLGERSKEIGRIVDVITNIADQTNLLALNAAIEAARAGEAGRGFAVVAEEVRKLAENSAQAAKQIGGLIRTIQDETSKAVVSVQTTSKEVEGGRVIIDKVRDGLEHILEAAKGSAGKVGLIVQATEMQLDNSKEVSKAVVEVANIAKDSVSSTEDVTCSIEEMTASMQEMSGTAQELANMASVLQKLVQKFNVRS